MTEEDLKSTKQSLVEQITLRKAHQETELRLNQVCVELKATLESTTSDLKGYQEKLGMHIVQQINCQLERTRWRKIIKPSGRWCKMT